MSEPFRKHSLVEKVYQHLVVQLASCEHKVGSRLNPREIASELDVSRTTINKVMERLLEDGYIKINDARHAIVMSLPPKLEVIKPREFEFFNQTDSTYETLLERILRGDLKPGEIVKERPLATELGINPATVRRAAEWLRGDGLLERLPRRGWRVTSLSSADIRDTYGIRLLLEPRAASCAARWISDEDIASLGEETQRLRELGEKASVYDRREADYRFHRTLCQASGNRILAETLEPLIRRVLIIGTVRFRFGRVTDFFEEHQVILDALRNRDEKEAVKAMKTHLRNAMKFHVDILEHH